MIDMHVRNRFKVPYSSTYGRVNIRCHLESLLRIHPQHPCMVMFPHSLIL
jgi:hypothetical protein